MAAVAMMGSSLSEEQANLIIDLVGSRGQVLILLDNDPSRGWFLNFFEELKRPVPTD